MLQVDEMRGSPMTVGSMEEIIDEKCEPPLKLQRSRALLSPPAAEPVHGTGW